MNIAINVLNLIDIKTKFKRLPLCSQSLKLT